MRRIGIAVGVTLSLLAQHGVDAQPMGKVYRVGVLSEGPRLIFGGRSDARAKWAAAARVLAEPSAQGALYLDLRIRGRVAAGGVGPVDPDEEAAEDGTANPQP